MNIDLLLTEQGEAGLIADTDYEAAVAGVMFDGQTGQISLELGDMDALELNIPVSQDLARRLSHTYEIHVAVIKRGVIQESRQVPLVLINDPFGGGNTGQFAIKPRSSAIALESFMNRATMGQPAHRDDLGNEAAAGSVMGGISATTLQFSPQLARQRTMEAAPRTPGAHHAPSAPGLGPKGAGGGHRPPPRQTQSRPPEDEE